ncbi:MAG: hypothetical protein K2O54_01115, partial [Prevotella sp.]|nr:hypothetical protein [Prevotella sp.]
MKLSRILTTAAAAAAVTAAMTASASAEYNIVDGVQPWIDQSAGNYLVILYSTGTAPDDVKAVDLGLSVADVGQIDSAKFTFKIDDADGMMDLDYGGCIGSSAHECVNNPGGSELYSMYNWNTEEWYGFEDPDLDINTLATEKTMQTVKEGDLTYSVSGKIKNAVANGDLDDLTSFRVFCSDWGIMSYTTMEKSEFFDASGNLVLALDGKGNVLSTTFDLGSSNSAAPAADNNAPAADENNAPAATPSAPAASDSKGSPDTGVEGVAALAGVALIAAGAVTLAK